VKKLLFLAGMFLGLFLWFSRNSPGVGEWMRRMSDGPTNLMLLGTSGFERDGVDPAKA
jgi:hypothetical protein